MANKWNIPKELENFIKERDKECVYCHVAFTPRKVNVRTSATWEHIDNNTTNITAKNIALCCSSCNASKGAKSLSDWLQSKYCQDKKITLTTIAVKDF